MNVQATLLTLFSLLFFQNIKAQVPVQTLRGVVYNAQNQRPLEGATVAFFRDTVLQKGMQTGVNGDFVFENVEVGRYQMQVNYVAYETLLLSEILVESGKETVLKINLKENTTLQNVVVKAARERLTHPTSIHTLTVEEVLRFPATYNDPARLAMTLPGVVGDNDQGSGIAIRGNSPNSLSWRLEGAEIVNPNHTPNAGTFSDRITLNGGGVNILSAQMMDNATFLTGAFPAQYGNALGGVMDVHLREGNANKHEFTAQIGLIGAEVAAEGPIKKSSDNWASSSFLANYRYSTIGLLSAMGVDLGDEEIAFQDIALKVHFVDKKGGQFSIFGMGGNSKNIFAAQRDSTAWEFTKDRMDITFRSKMGAGGLAYQLPIGQKSFWKNTLVYSSTNSTRLGEVLDTDYLKSLVENDNWTQSKTAFRSVFSHKINTLYQVKAGVDVTSHQYDLVSQDAKFGTLVDGVGGGVMVQPFAEWQLTQGKMNVTIGLHGNYFTLNNKGNIEPRTSISYAFNTQHKISVTTGVHSQLQSPQLYFAGQTDNQNLDFTKSAQLVFNYRWQNGRGSQFTTEAFAQNFQGVPISTDMTSTFSALNLLEGFVTDSLVNEGTGQNLGIEFGFQKYFTRDFYCLVNTTLYDAKYTAADGIERNARYNGGYIVNVTGGKEFTKNKANKQRTWGVNARIGSNGGFRYTPIDRAASVAAGTTIFDETNAYSEQYPAFFRVDLRVYLRRNKAKYSSLLALDIQNVTNQKNIAFVYYDVIQEELVKKYQLPLLPILSYKIEF